jgi:hypothetical protein
MRMNKIVLSIALVMGLFSLGAASAVAGDDALYDAPIPADKSLVRFLNAQQAPGTSVVLNGQTYTLDADVLSKYKIIAGGTSKVSAQNAEITADFQPKKFYTVVIGATSAGLQPITVLEDSIAKNRSGSSLTFYNLTAGSADLAVKLKGKSKNVFSKVTQGTQAFREIVPIDLGVDVIVDGKVAKSFEKVSLSASDRQSVIATSVGNEVRAFVVSNSIEE